MPPDDIFEDLEFIEFDLTEDNFFFQEFVNDFNDNKL